jgi:multimeric flavodoxin WrbA
MKNIIAINGSPRKTANTAKLLQSAVDGFCAGTGAQGEIVNLYDLKFKGCVSCFACKLKGAKSYGKCAHIDELTPILEKIEHADALVFGSPVYFGNVTGEMRSFLERLLFQYLVYDKNYSSLNTNKIPTAFIYTMNVDENRMKEFQYPSMLAVMEKFIINIFGACEALYVTDTKQFDDYSKYVSEAFDPAHKAKRHEEHFPAELKRARELGKNMAG